MQYKIIVDKQPSSNPSSEKKEYIVDIEELRVKGDIYDSINIEIDRTYVTRRLSLSEYGVLTELEEPIIQELPDLNIELFEGDNYIYLMDMQGNKFYAEYLIKNDFNDIYATKNEMNSAITQTAQSIELSVNQKLTGYSTTQEMNSAIQLSAQNINLSVNEKLEDYSTTEQMNSAINLSAQSITSSVSATYATKETTNQLSTRIKQTAKSIELAVTDNDISAGITIKLRNEDGTQIDSKSANITMSGLVKFTDLSKSGSTTINGSNITTGTIDASKVTVSNLNASNITSGTITGRAISGGTITGTSITNGNNFSVDKNGNVSCQNININGGKIKLDAGTSSNPNFKIGDNLFMTDTYFSIGQEMLNGDFITISASSYGTTEININSGGQQTRILASEITTPKLICPDVTPSSTERIKKNISKWTKNATEIINNADIYEYNLKTDEDTDRKMIGFVIGDKYRTPDEVLSKDGEAVRLYSIACILWKGFQEQEEKINKLMEVVR